MIGEDKDSSIRKLVERLPVNAMNWLIVDHWEGDKFAIGIAHASLPQRLVYVSTFKQAQLRYRYECETPCQESNLGFVVASEADDVTFEALLDAIRSHLG